jgi:uncharacterized membrane protein HdeD (DUF308 family)
MFSDYRIRSLSGWTMFIFGVLAFVLGLLGILNPELQLNLLNLLVLDRADRAPGDYTLAFATAASMASFNMGIYYVLAAFTHLKKFFWWTVPFRMVTFVVFTIAVLTGTAPQAFIGVAVWELVGALATGGALLYERGRSPAAA